MFSAPALASVQAREFPNQPIRNQQQMPSPKLFASDRYCASSA
jgi:hypothetical protein